MGSTDFMGRNAVLDRLCRRHCQQRFRAGLAYRAMPPVFEKVSGKPFW